MQARIDTNTSSESGEASAYGLVGKGSVTVQEMRFTQGDEILME